ncbi:hypothetical protein TNCV_4675651 [Trichonephila clavipes]|nr:hypothetical protein TNCV_4675651 [Trichonephila clavipes]
MSAENVTSAIKLFAFPTKILIIEPVLAYILEEGISKNIPAKYRQSIRKKKDGYFTGTAWSSFHSGRFLGCHVSSKGVQIFEWCDLQQKQRASRTPNSSGDPRRSAYRIEQVIWTTWSGITTEEHVLRQEVKAGLVAKRSNILYRPKEGIEGIRSIPCCVRGGFSKAPTWVLC